MANIQALSAQIATFDQCVDFLRNRGILRNNPPNCQNCGHIMTEVRVSNMTNDEKAFRCPRHKGCKMSFREGY